MTDDAIRVSGPINADGLEMTLETGKLAQLAHGAVVVKVGGTTVLSTVTTSKPREGIDFFPLTVDVEERMYAAGKIPGSFFRREGRPGEQAILTARLTDRPLRPSFPDDFRNEVQVIATVLGVDLENPHDVPSINGASAALTVSGIPFNGPIGAVRLAHYEGEWIAQPTFEEGDKSTFEIVVAGRALDNGDVAIMMVEAGGTEAAWDLYQEGAPKVTEETLAGGLEEAKRWIKASIDLQTQLREAYEKARGPIEPIEYLPALDYSPEVYAAVKRHAETTTADAMGIADKSDRNSKLAEIEADLIGSLVGSGDAPGAHFEEATGVKRAFRSLQKEVTRRRIVNDGVRIDGRGPSDIRPLSAEVGVVETAHGTGLFKRGETQVLSVTTLGMPRMEQMLDTITLDSKKRYMHHYNFPPFSTGETGRVGSPKRREIGHGALAERALLPVVPDAQEWPYTLRVVSDVLASNGSTSMASVCGSTLSLMDAGVPIKAPVAGIAMGLVYAEGKYTTLTDILGAEDAFGDMDFKVAGTEDFVTALQLDTKIEGIPADVLAQALLQAKEARLKILEVMKGAISAPREEVRDSAPKIISFDIPIDKIGEVIGPKGKVINTIQQETGADITVSDDDGVGIVSIGSKDGEAVKEAQRRIELILDPPTAEVGAIYEGRVVNITKFGAFVNILPGRDGLVHISKLGRGKRIDRVEDVLSLGDELSVRVDDIDQNGKLSLSLVGEDGDVVEGSGSSSGSGSGDGGGSGDGDRGPRERAPRERESVGGRETASFESFWEEQAKEEFGDLGPGEEPGPSARSGGDRGDRGRGGRGGRGGGGGRGRGGPRR
ncbi:MAG TPA: polyribonucleotide nucleotidyltransferase [Acidimicrobiia bacterium]|jgi:polyribonucleotide nucleotidyltransferase|nr:polyribonucleotide nucleotidyltransferase [Acidimicrobiia bacterium]